MEVYVFTELALFTLVPFDSATVASGLEKMLKVDLLLSKSAPTGHRLRPYDR